MKRSWTAAFLLLALTASTAMAVMTPEDVKLDGMSLTIVATGQKIDVEPLQDRQYTAKGKLKVVTPDWREGFRLPATSWTYQMLRKGSLVVTRADKPGVTLAEGVDYVVNTDWGTVGAVKGSATPPGTPLQFTYAYTYTRLDLLVKDADGRYRLIKGKPNKNQLRLPAAPEGTEAVLSVYLPPNTTELTLKNINFIDPAFTNVPPVAGKEFLAKTRAKLAKGEPVTIVFLGDSITAQKFKEFRDGRGSYVDRFTTWMKDRHGDREVVTTTRRKIVRPAGSQIVIVKSGVGGDDTARALRRLKPDVTAHKPDAVIVMFGANDENRRGKGNAVPPAKYKANLTTIVEKVSKDGAEVVLMTPSMKNLGWSATVGNMNEYAAAVRQVAKARKTCLVDNFTVWENLPKLGYNYMIFLGTCINHPVDHGHEVFFQGLKAAFEGE